MPPIISQSHSYPRHHPNLGIKENITKQALFSLSMIKFRNEVLYRMFPLSAIHVLCVALWMFDDYVTCHVRDSKKHK